MSTLILNTSNNVAKFENRFVDDISKGLNHNYAIYEVSGEALVEQLDITETDLKVILIIAHASSTGDETLLDIGFRIEGQLPITVNNPEVLSQLISYSNSDHVVIYCSCQAATASTIAASIDNPRVKGVIATEKKPNEMWVNAIAELVNKIHEVNLQNTDASTNIRTILAEIERLYPYGMNLQFFPNEILSEDDDCNV